MAAKILKFAVLISLAAAMPVAQAHRATLGFWKQPATPVLVQHRSTVSHTTSGALAYSSNVTAGNLLIACGMVFSGAQVGISDNQNDNWLFAGNIVAGSGEGYCWYTPYAVGGATTVTITDSAGNIVNMAIAEVTGGYNVLDGLAINSGATGATITATTAHSVQNAEEYVMAFAFDSDTDQTLSQGAGYTLQEQSHDGVDQNVVGFEDMNSRTGLSGTQTATVTKPSNSDNWGEIVLTFQRSPTYLVQEATANPAGGSGTRTLTIPATASGNLLVLGLTYFNQSACTASVKDNAPGGNNIYVSASAFSHDTNAGGAEIWYVPNSLAGGTTITVTVNGGCTALQYALFFTEVAGMQTSSPLDGSPSINSNHSAGTTISATTVTPTTSRSLIYSIASVQNSVYQTAPGNPLFPVTFVNGDAVGLYFTKDTNAYGGSWLQNISGTYNTSTVIFKGR